MQSACQRCNSAESLGAGSGKRENLAENLALFGDLAIKSAVNFLGGVVAVDRACKDRAKAGVGSAPSERGIQQRNQRLKRNVLTG